MTGLRNLLWGTKIAGGEALALLRPFAHGLELENSLGRVLGTVRKVRPAAVSEAGATIRGLFGTAPEAAEVLHRELPLLPEQMWGLHPMTARKMIAARNAQLRAQFRNTMGQTVGAIQGRAV